MPALRDLQCLSNRKLAAIHEQQAGHGRKLNFKPETLKDIKQANARHGGFGKLQRAKLNRVAVFAFHAWILALLPGCVPAPSAGVCPGLTLPTYSREMQTQAALELASLPRGAALRVIVNDAGELRARVRAVCP